MRLYIGDLIFPEPDGLFGKGIALITRSHFAHVGMVYNDDWIFEAHFGTNIRLNPLNKYIKKKFIVLRPMLTNKEKHHIKKLMTEFNGTHYSLWDIGTNFTFSWLKPELRRKLVDWLGSKKMMICSELIGRILYTANSSKYEYFKYYGGLQPEDIFTMGLKDSMKEILDAVAAPPDKIVVVDDRKDIPG